MKDGTKYAGKLKTTFNKLKKSKPENKYSDSGDCIYQLALAVFSENGNIEKARKAVDKIVDNMVDWNEVRVSTPAEIVRISGMTDSDAEDRAEKLSLTLQSVYDRENELSLQNLEKMPRREVKTYLEELTGFSPYVSGFIILWALEGHAIPVDDDMLTALQDEDLVHPKADLRDVKAFLERNVNAADAKDFVISVRTLIKTRKPKSSTTTKKTKKATTKATKKKSTTKKAKKKTTKKTTKKKTANKS